MRSRFLVRLAWRALVRNKLRSFLALLGIMIGVASVVAMVAIGQGASASIRSAVASMGTNLLQVRPGSASSSGTSWGAGSAQTLMPADADAIRAECPSVRSVSPIIRHRAQIVYEDKNWVPDSIEGVGEEFPAVTGWDAVDGRWFDAQEVRSAAKVCLVGKTLARELFGEEPAVGRTIRVGNVPFEVIGLLKRRGANTWGRDQDDTLILPWTTAQKRLTAKWMRSVDHVSVSAVSPEAVQRAKEEIERVLRDRHRIRSDQASDFNIRDMSESMESLRETSRVMSTLLAAIASISLLVGGIGIMNIMLVSVTERTREIGIRMAVGARSGDILRQFLVESMVLSLAGGAMGLAIGATASRLVSQFAQWPTELSPASMVVAILFSAGIGIGFGFYPAWKASRLDPIDCLRYE